MYGLQERIIGKEGKGGKKKCCSENVSGVGESMVGSGI